MVNIHEEAMVIEETLEEATVIQEEGAMKATTCPTMMVTSQGVIMAVQEHKAMTLTMITAMLQVILVVQIIWADAMMAKETMMMNLRKKTQILVLFQQNKFLKT